jgi:hypothetical protein
LQGKSVVNKDKGITIKFTAIGGKKIAFGGRNYKSKMALLQCLDTLMEVAEYNNFGQPKAKDIEKKIVGFLNFKAKVMIDGQLKHVRIAVIKRKEATNYYSHEINAIKIKEELPLQP